MRYGRSATVIETRPCYISKNPPAAVTMSTDLGAVKRSSHCAETAGTAPGIPVHHFGPEPGRWAGQRSRRRHSRTGLVRQDSGMARRVGRDSGDGRAHGTRQRQAPQRRAAAAGFRDQKSDSACSGSPRTRPGRRCFPQSRPGAEASTPPPCTATRQQWARRSPAAACRASSCSSRPGPAGHTPGSRCPPARSPRQSQSAPGPAQTRRPAGRVPVARGLGKARAGRPRRLLRYGRLARGVHRRLSSGAGPGHQVHQGIGDRGDFPGADVRVPGRLAVPGAAEPFHGAGRRSGD